jgi:antitoxin CcdA
VNDPSSKRQNTAPARKKPTNISLPVDIFQDAKALNINISHFCEQKLREEISLRKDQQWNQQHAAFIATYNATVESEGIALQEWRTF